MTQDTEIIGLAWYAPEHYDAIRRVMADGDNLPDTFVEWRLKATGYEEAMQREGKTVVRVLIDPESFTDWCRAKGLNVDAKARMLYAAFIAKLQQDSRDAAVKH